MKSPYEIIDTLLRTEKGTIQAEARKYFFSVSKSANKIEIKKAVETIYKVKVDAVNTQVVPGKLKRVRREQGYTSEWKKAVVTLKDGHKIDLA
jgi:large subunit ribosomal protein L23